MQMFGVGILELMVILLLAVIVVGPDRLPAVAADLARWIRQGRAYARVMTKDFNEVVGELEKEAGANREDWKEIASVVDAPHRRHRQGDRQRNSRPRRNGRPRGGEAAGAVKRRPHRRGSRRLLASRRHSQAMAPLKPHPLKRKPLVRPEKPRASRRRSSE